MVSIWVLYFTHHTTLIELQCVLALASHPCIKKETMQQQWNNYVFSMIYLVIVLSTHYNYDNSLLSYLAVWYKKVHRTVKYRLTWNWHCIQRQCLGFMRPFHTESDKGNIRLDFISKSFLVFFLLLHFYL